MRPSVRQVSKEMEKLEKIGYLESKVVNDEKAYRLKKDWKKLAMKRKELCGKCMNAFKTVYLTLDFGDYMYTMLLCNECLEETQLESFLKEWMDPGALNMMQTFKEMFDPNGILNPGKIFDFSPSCEGRLP